MVIERELTQLSEHIRYKYTQLNYKKSISYLSKIPPPPICFEHFNHDARNLQLRYCMLLGSNSRHAGGRNISNYCTSLVVP